MYLKIKPLTDELNSIYLNHSHYNPGDTNRYIFSYDYNSAIQTICIDLKIQRKF